MKCDLSNFDCGMIVGARQGGLSISETSDLLGFSRTTVSRTGVRVLVLPKPSLSGARRSGVIGWGAGTRQGL